MAEDGDHDGYGLCSGFGRMWVDDGRNSNFYEGGSCRRCVRMSERLSELLQSSQKRATGELTGGPTGASAQEGEERPW
jgi:hypothetical protein